MARVVTAPAVQVTAGGRTYFLERGALVPDGVEQDVLDRLTEEGMLSELPEVVPVDEEAEKAAADKAAAEAAEREAAEKKAADEKAAADKAAATKK